MKAQHTPGPWTFSKCPCGDPICRRYFVSVTSDGRFSEEDARLVAAAPDMLYALHQIASRSKVGIIKKIAQEAIAKAKGL
jgi:hypothetical protein